MTILAIDAATQNAGAALLTGKYIIAECNVNAREAFPNGPAHSETLLPAINNLFGYSGLTPEAVDFVACASGPGSFTGLRIGAATAMGIAKGIGRPLVPVPTLDSLAYNIVNGAEALPGSIAAPVMDARRGQVYAAFYRWDEDGKPRRLTDYLAEDIHSVLPLLSGFEHESVIFLGDGADAYREIITESLSDARFAPPHLNRCRAASAGVCAMDMLSEGFKPVDNFELLYVRKPQAVRDREKKLGKERKFKIEPATDAHVDRIHEVEARTFAIPWSKKSIYDDIVKNIHSMYFVALDGDNIAGYAGMWHVVNEGHVTNIAVDEPYRRQGAGALLMDRLIAEAKRFNMIGVTLEVRVGNRAAMGLYNKYGFKVEGLRKNYYADTKEDAAIMWKYL